MKLSAYALKRLRLANLAKGRAALKAKKSKRRTVHSNPPANTLRVTRLGKALELRYQHASDGRYYRHRFGRGTAVTYTDDGKHLVIGPVQVKDFIDD